MVSAPDVAAPNTPSPPAPDLRLSAAPLYFGGWEAGLLMVMAALYLVGLYLNPAFFGTTQALSAILRDAANYGVMAVGMSFVIINKDLDLSVGSTFGVVAVLFSILFAPSHYDMGALNAVCLALAMGLAIGLLNGFLVTVLEVPAFIGTLTMLFIGRGIVLGLTGGQNIAFEVKARDYPTFFALGDSTLGFSNQTLVFLVVAVLGAILLAATRFGWQIYATGGNEMAARYAGIATRRVRRRAYVISALCAAIAGLMSVAQTKGVDSQTGGGGELIVIAAVIVGGAAIMGGRGRVFGSCCGAVLMVLVDKVLREGVPITRIIAIGDEKIEVAALAQLPPGAIPAFLGLILVIAVLIEPLILRRRLVARLIARLRRLPLPPILEAGGIAIAGVQTKGAYSQARSLNATGLKAFLFRRDAAAVLIMGILWLMGWYARPDFWAGIDNSFAMLLAFSEIALLSVGLTLVLANGDIDLSVGSVLALSGATAAVCMKDLALPPLWAGCVAFAAGTAAGVINGLLTTRARLPAFVATLAMFYIARGLGAWMVAGSQLSGFPDNFTLIGRTLFYGLEHFALAPTTPWLVAVTKEISIQTIFAGLVALIIGILLARTPYGQKLYAIGGNERAARYAGINTSRVRMSAFILSAMCAASAGILYAAYYRSFSPVAGELRELDAIAAVIIGGGSIFGGYGTIIGSLAGAAVITLIRSLLQLQIVLQDGSSFVLPQHWMNLFIGLILLIAVIIDIWVRQNQIFSQWFGRIAARMPQRAPQRPTPPPITAQGEPGHASAD